MNDVDFDRLVLPSKINSHAVSVEIRNMVNGYPEETVLPFSTVTKNPADINISQDGSLQQHSHLIHQYL